MAAKGGPLKNGATRTIRLDTPQYPGAKTKVTTTKKVKIKTGKRTGRGANTTQKS